MKAILINKAYDFLTRSRIFPTNRRFYKLVYFTEKQMFIRLKMRSLAIKYRIFKKHDF